MAGNIENTETDSEITITDDELVAAVLAAFTPTDDTAGMTTEELSEQIGRSNKWILAQLRRLRKDGRLDVVRRLTETLDGRMIRVPAYVLRNGQKADSAAD